MDTQFARIDYVTGLYWSLGVAGRLVDKGVPLNDTTEVNAVRTAGYINKEKEKGEEFDSHRRYRGYR